MHIAVIVDININIGLVHIGSTLIGGICTIYQGDIAGAVQYAAIVFKCYTGIVCKCLLGINRLSRILDGHGLAGSNLGAQTHSVVSGFYERAFHHEQIVQPNLIGNGFLSCIFFVLTNIGQNLHIEIGRCAHDTVISSHNFGSGNYCIELCCFILIGEFYIQHTVNFQHTDHK